MQVAAPRHDLRHHGIGATIDLGVKSRRLCVRGAQGAQADDKGGDEWKGETHGRAMW
jgi:hypothetical protein